MAVVYINPQQSHLNSTEHQHNHQSFIKGQQDKITPYINPPTNYLIHEHVSISLERAPGTTPSCHHSHERRRFRIRLRPTNRPFQTFWAPRKRFQQIPLPP